VTSTRKQESQRRYGAVALFSCLSERRPSGAIWSQEEQMNKEGSPP
jgi:hypothetical protein